MTLMNTEEIIIDFKTYALEIEKFYNPDNTIESDEEYHLNLMAKLNTYMMSLNSHKQGLLLEFDKGTFHDSLEHDLTHIQSVIYSEFIERFKRK